jgi:hypothetical protein
MQEKRRRLAPVLVFAALAVGAIGYLWWLTSPGEFRGTLRYTPRMGGFPEDPPPLAYLVMESGTHELDIPRHMRTAKLLQDLEDMNGKEVVVRGKRGIRRTMWRKHPAIRVDELRLR